jgi:dihydrolipoamide dehydrogenase
MKRLGINAFAGQGRFIDAQTVAVAGTRGEITIEAAHVVIATGSQPDIPPGLAPVPGKVLTTDMLFDARPPLGERVAIVGGGVIGAEFAFILRQFGKDIAWFTNRAPLARTLFSPQALSTLKNAFAQAGVVARQGVRVQTAAATNDGVRLSLSDGGTLTVDWVLIGTGRAPYTTGLNAEAAGVALDERGFVRTNDALQTTVPHIYAIGDCVSEWMTANQALRGAAIAVDNIVSDSGRTHDPLWVPEVVYSAVELARVGMNEDLAEDAEREPAVGFAAFETSPRALGQDDTAGFVRVLGDLDDASLLGGEVVGSEAGELIHILSLAPDRDTALRWLAAGSFNHPARAEEFQNATETLATKWSLADQIFGSADE